MSAGVHSLPFAPRGDDATRKTGMAERFRCGTRPILSAVRSFQQSQQHKRSHEQTPFIVMCGCIDGECAEFPEEAGRNQQERVANDNLDIWPQGLWFWG